MLLFRLGTDSTATRPPSTSTLSTSTTWSQVRLAQFVRCPRRFVRVFFRKKNFLWPNFNGICINKFIVIFINLKTNVLFYSSLFSPFFSLSFNTFLLSKNFNDFFLVFSVQRGKVQNKNQGELCADLPHLQVSCLVSILKDNYSPYPTIGCLVFTFLIKFHVFKDF